MPLTEKERRAIERSAMGKYPLFARIAATIIIALVAIPVLVMWGGLMVRLARWAF